MAERFALKGDLILSKLYKPYDVEMCLNNLTSAVSSIEE